MKKFFIIFFITICFCNCAFANEDRFITSLRNCSAFSDSGNVTVDGISAASTKQILGWQNDYCKYKETITINNIKTNIDCNFSKYHIKEISSVADAYYLTLKYSGENPDTSSLDAVKSNPLTNVFNKYLQDPSVCTITLPE